MKIAKQNGLCLYSRKCKIKAIEIFFFGMLLTQSDLRPDPTKVADLQNMPSPTSKQELEEFLGMITYLGQFIDNLAKNAQPLRQLLKKDIPFEWDATYQTVFDTLKTLINQDACLQFYDSHKPVQLMTDASKKGLGAALLQPNADGRYQPVAYASKSLTKTQAEYANIERELLAVCHGVERFKTYLYGRHFNIITDHKPLVSILSKPLSAVSPRLQSMVLKLHGYSFDIEYRPGKDIPLADSLSRLPNPENNEPIKLPVRINFVSFKPSKLDSLRQATERDHTLQQLIYHTSKGWPEQQLDVPPEIREYWDYRDEINVYDGLALKGSRIIIPESEREDILKQLHNGHMGITKTTLRSKNSFLARHN
jgi:hypothetical protein